MRIVVFLIAVLVSGTVPAASSQLAATSTAAAFTTAPVAAAPVAPLDRRPAPHGAFGWPLAGSPEVVRPFEPPPHEYGPGHRGVDLRGTPGEPVLAAGDGTVSFAGMVAGRPVVAVDHPNGLRTTYEPVTPSVAPGHLVGKGDDIGTLLPGHAGCPAQACLHWGVRRGDTYLDPLWLLAPARVRLLPATGLTAAGRSRTGRPFSRTRPPAACRAAEAPPWCAAGTPVTRSPPAPCRSRRA